MFVRRQAGIEHFFNGRMSFQTARDFECVLAMDVHAQSQRFDTAQHQPAVHRPAIAPYAPSCRAKAEPALWFWQRLRHQYVGMAAQIFGSGMEHKIATHIQRLLQIRRGKGMSMPTSAPAALAFAARALMSTKRKSGLDGVPANQFDIVRFEQLVQIIRIAQIGKNNVHTPFLINIDQ